MELLQLELISKINNILFSDGKISGGVNHEGVEYYNNVINELMSKG